MIAVVCGVAKLPGKRPDGVGELEACQTFTSAMFIAGLGLTSCVGVESGSRASGCYGSEFYLCDSAYIATSF